MLHGNAIGVTSPVPETFRKGRRPANTALEKPQRNVSTKSGNVSMEEKDETFLHPNGLSKLVFFGIADIHDRHRGLTEPSSAGTVFNQCMQNLECSSSSEKHKITTQENQMSSEVHPEANSRSVPRRVSTDRADMAVTITGTASLSLNAKPAANNDTAAQTTVDRCKSTESGITEPSFTKMVFSQPVQNQLCMPSLVTHARICNKVDRSDN
ncbi:hypothetical protein Tco_0737625 [Tanacetum coccineum]